MKPTSAIIAHDAQTDRRGVTIFRGSKPRFYQVNKYTIARLARILRRSKAVFCGQSTIDGLTCEQVTL